MKVIYKPIIGNDSQLQAWYDPSTQTAEVKSTLSPIMQYFAICHEYIHYLVDKSISWDKGRNHRLLWLVSQFTWDVLYTFFWPEYWLSLSTIYTTRDLINQFKQDYKKYIERR